MQRLLLLILLLKSTQLLACCAEDLYRLFPMGELNNKVIFLEFKYTRECQKEIFQPGTGDKNEFWIIGEIQLISFENDNRLIIKKLDSINIKECHCNYQNQYNKSAYESHIKSYYRNAFQILKLNPDFQEARTVAISFNDSTNIQTEIIGKSIKLNYKNLFEFKLIRKNIRNPFPKKISEVRIYETENHKITILRLSFNYLNKSTVKRNRKRFKSIKNAYWKEAAFSHGKSKDLLNILAKGNKYQ